jgi:hypothetical protein
LVFDTSGQRISQLLKNATLSSSGEISWNGEDETGQTLPTGLYIVWLEIFDMKGHVERFKSAVAITKRGD